MRCAVDTVNVLELNRRFHDEVEAESYDARMGVTHDLDSVKRMMIELESVRGAALRGGHVVDVGAGTGNVAIKLALTGRFSKVSAVDISRMSLETLSATARDLDCEVETIESDMMRLPFPDGSVDYVIGCAFLHHLPDPAAFMCEVKRVLRPGGTFVIIGEPSAFGAVVTEIVKLPLVLLNRCIRAITSRNTIRWDHDQIDVHTFTIGDVRCLTKGFTRTRLHSEGFLEPVIDQGLLVAVRALLGRVRGVSASCDLIRDAARLMDRHLFNRVLPTAARVTFKFSGVRGY